MIDLISNLVRYIVILLFLTVILEMILPQGTFRRYLRVLVGILLILTILSPLQKIMHMAPLWDDGAILPEAGMAGSGLSEVLAKGEELHEKTYRLALDDYRSNIFTLLEEELDSKFAKRLLQLDISLDEDPAGDRFGMIKELSLIVQDGGERGKKKQAAGKVQKISIRIQPGDQGGDSFSERPASAAGDEVARVGEREIARHLASFLQLPLEGVRVEIAGPD